VFTGQPAPGRAGSGKPARRNRRRHRGGDGSTRHSRHRASKGRNRHIIALEPRGKGLLGVTLRYPYEVRNEADYFDDIPDEKIPKDMLDLASHIVKTKAGHFEPSKFEDQYEDALKELLKKKQEGKPIERPEQPKPTNVVNLMDALRRSVEAGGAATSSKAKGRAAAPRSSSEKAEHPKRKRTRRTG
jgi:DNA end-binding protein Ku